jgi:Thermolysin metallopeptidase, alpha-helical domain
VTAHSSNLIYSGESGGLSEGFSDIFGTALEFYIDDSNDPPDFTMAEQAGEALRNMEHPLSKSIGSVCDYSSKLKVHYASGPLNKAYANSVRSCEANGCDDLRGCAILLGKVFLYSNIKGLTMTSNYLDSAKASCMLIDEFFLVRAPTTGCNNDEVKQFIVEGWKTVDVIVSGDCSSDKSCATPSTRPTDSPSTLPPTPTKFIPSALPTVTDPERDPPSVPSSAPSADSSDEGLWCRNVFRSVFSWVTSAREGAV